VISALFSVRKPGMLQVICRHFGIINGVKYWKIPFITSVKKLKKLGKMEY
jgi:hypothetical protein